MNIQVLLEKYFDVAFAAPNGVKKLRELILSLAMQGKLVAQDPHDVPASELLKEIQAEKNRLVKEGKIKLSKPLPEIKSDEVPYDLPKSWEWVRFGDLFKVTSGNNLTKDKMEEGVFPVYGGNGIAGYHSKFNTEKPTIVIGRVGYYCGSIHLTPERAWITDNAFFTIYDEKRLYQTFVIWILKTINLQIDTSATAQPVISGAKIYPIPIPIPPLAEQHRIVAKIDELMARCDELEKLRGNLNQKQITVHNAALNRLLTAKNQSDFNTAWQFITQHFGDLYSVKENVAELRKAILQLAVMGKLVPQDPSDRPASELLKEIEKEKEKLVKEGKIKKSKPLAEICPDEIPYDLPKSWKWLRVGSFAKSIDYGTSVKTDDDSAKIPVYRMGNIVNGKLINSGFKYVDSEIDDLPRLYLLEHDILFNRTNSYELVGKTAIYLGQDNNTTFASYLIRVRVFKEHLLSTYINMAMNSTYFRRTQIEPEIIQQCGQANFNGSKLSTTLIPIPPLAEQHRIVAKCDRLMALCDNLEKQIDNSNSKKINLLNAVMTKV